MKFILGFYNKSVILTYVGAIAAVTGIALSFWGNTKLSILCLIICGIADLFDGMIARRCKRSDKEKKFGIQIDSLTDMVSFAIFPVVISFALGNVSWYHILVCSVYVLAAITRLGYFNVVTANDDGAKFYTGLPVTFASLIIVPAYVTGKLLNIANYLVFASIIAMSLLFILRFKFKKPRGIAYIFIGVFAIIMTVAVILVG